MFNDYLTRWQLTPDGDPIATHSSRLLPVRWRGEPAMLKVIIEPEERHGHVLMSWWNGDGAARVLAQEPEALLLERATGARSLAAYARDGRDDEATRILCAAIARLHGHAKPRPPNLIPLQEWFAELEPAARQHGGVLARSAATARELLAHPQDIVALHGDIHHGNVLDFGARGWLAIDPKGLIGERGFDYANIFCNPDLVTATAPSCFARRVDVMVEVAGLDRVRLLQWVLAWAGLSAAWFLGAAAHPELDFKIAELAADELR